MKSKLYSIEEVSELSDPGLEVIKIFIRLKVIIQS